MSARLRALCDALGYLVKFALMPGQRHDSKGVEELIRNQKFEALLADKAFDVQWLIERLQVQGVPIVTSQRPNRRQPLSIDEPGTAGLTLIVLPRLARIWRRRLP